MGGCLQLLVACSIPYPFPLFLPPHPTQCVAYIAAAEIPTGQWPELIATLLLNVTAAQSTEALKVASLEAIGYICEEIVSCCTLLGEEGEHGWRQGWVV